MGKHMKAYVLLSIRTGDVREVLKHLSRIPAVLEANFTFGPYDAVVVLEGADVKEIGLIVAGDIQPIPGVMETLTCLAVDLS
jgi:DNA-binding Lrp family transcriptional regulator